MRHWHLVLDQLKLEMTPITFDQWLKDVIADEPKDGVLVIHASQAVAKQWTVAPRFLDERLRIPITRAVTLFYKQELKIHFEVNGSNSVEPLSATAHNRQPDSAGLSAAAHNTAGDNELLSATAHDENGDENGDQDSALQEIAFNHQEIVGFAKHSHYLATFGRAYLGATPFDVWDFVRGHCSDSSLIWTEPFEITGIDLARGVGCHRQRIVGVWRNCAKFDEAFFEGEALVECCGEHAGAEMVIARSSKAFPQGRPVCRFWVYGALEILEAEGWAVYQRHGDSPKNTFYTIQIYQRPPPS